VETAAIPINERVSVMAQHPRVTRLGTFLARGLLRIRGKFAGRVAVLAAATGFQAAISVVQILLVTRVLSAEDFGTYGMLMSGVALAGAICEGGAGWLIPAHHAVATPIERARMFTTVAVFATAIGTFLGLLLLIFWPRNRFVLGGNQIEATSFGVVIIVAILTPLRPVVQQMNTVFSVSGRGIAIALQMFAQSICGFLVTLAALFLFEVGVAALFLGTLAGSLDGLGLSFELRQPRLQGDSSMPLGT
jgi:O-antigen/teichoic acid export membrane protein